MRPFVENFPFFSIFLAILSGIVCAVLKDERRAFRLTLCALAVITVLSAATAVYTVSGGVSFIYTMGRFAAPYGNAIQCGPLQSLLSAAFSMVMALSLIGGSRDLFHDVLAKKLPLYCTMVNLTMAALLALIHTNDIFTGYVFLEISTITSCALVMAKDTGSNLVASIRYLFMSLLGSSLFLIGLTLLNSVTGYLLMPPLAQAVAELGKSGEYATTLTVAVGLIVAGLGVKSAMFPFHLWLPDAHGGATTASSAILSGLVLKGYIMLLVLLMVRVFSLELLTKMGITNILLAFGLLGMIVGSLSAIREHHVKRMLAYSSVAQVGYIFMGLGLGTETGVAASCFHVLVHACCKPLLFCCVGRLSAVSGHHKSLRNLRGSAYRDPVAGVGFTVGALSMVGIPLFGGFASKFYFVNASIGSRQMALVLLVIALSTVLNALYYIPAVLAIWEAPSRELRESLAAAEDPQAAAFDWRFTVAAVVLTAGIFVLGIFYHGISDVITAGVRLL